MYCVYIALVLFVNINLIDNAFVVSVPPNNDGLENEILPPKSEVNIQNSNISNTIDRDNQNGSTNGKFISQ